MNKKYFEFSLSNLLPAVFAFQLACFPQPESTLTQEVQSIRSQIEALPKVVCASGEVLNFSLVFPVTQDLPGLTFVENGKIFKTTPASYEVPVRFEVCLNIDAEVDLQRVVTTSKVFSRANPTTTLIVVNKDQFQNTKGISSAFFGDSSQLYAEAILDNLFRLPTRLVIQGWSAHSFTTISVHEYDPANPTSPSNIEPWQTSNIPVGELQNFDVFSDSPCDPGAKLETIKFALDTARFEAKICSFDANLTRGYEFVSVSVSDSSLILPVELRNKTVTIDVRKDSHLMRSNFNHHNHCDSFFLSVPSLKAQYAATSSQIEESIGDSVVEGAPDCVSPGVGRALTTRFQISYEAKAGAIGNADFSHFAL